jgi:hypothetical protein
VTLVGVMSDEIPSAVRSSALLSRGILLERVTLGWNVVGILVLVVAATAARSVALAGFGLDSLVEIGASAVVLGELAAVDESQQHRALRPIGAVFVALSVDIVVQSLPSERRPGEPSRPGTTPIAWCADVAKPGSTDDRDQGARASPS